jgi:hypothetical protein
MENNEAAERRQMTVVVGCGSRRSQNLSPLQGSSFIVTLILGLTPQATLCRRFAADVTNSPIGSHLTFFRMSQFFMMLRSGQPK